MAGHARGSSDRQRRYSRSIILRAAVGLSLAIQSPMASISAATLGGSGPHAPYLAMRRSNTSAGGLPPCSAKDASPAAMDLVDHRAGGRFEQHVGQRVLSRLRQLLDGLDRLGELRGHGAMNSVSCLPFNRRARSPCRSGGGSMTHPACCSATCLPLRSRPAGLRRYPVHRSQAGGDVHALVKYAHILIAPSGSVRKNDVAAGVDLRYGGANVRSVGAGEFAARERGAYVADLSDVAFGLCDAPAFCGPGPESARCPGPPRAKDRTVQANSARLAAMKASKSKGSAGPLASPSARASRRASSLVSCSSRRRRPARTTSLAEAKRPEATSSLDEAHEVSAEGDGGVLCHGERIPVCGISRNRKAACCKGMRAPACWTASG